MCAARTAKLPRECMKVNNSSHLNSEAHLVLEVLLSIAECWLQQEAVFMSSGTGV